jgi:hypothetical protein
VNESFAACSCFSEICPLQPLSYNLLGSLLGINCIHDLAFNVFSVFKSKNSRLQRKDVRNDHNYFESVLSKDLRHSSTEEWQDV